MILVTCYLFIIISSLEGHSCLKYIRCFARFARYHLCNLKNVKNIHGRMSPLVKLQAYFTKSNTLPYMFFTFLKLYKWCQIAQRITRKLTARDKTCCVSITLKAVNPFSTTQTKTSICQCFFLDYPKMIYIPSDQSCKRLRNNYSARPTEENFTL